MRLLGASPALEEELRGRAQLRPDVVRRGRVQVGGGRDLTARHGGAIPAKENMQICTQADDRLRENAQLRW